MDQHAAPTSTSSTPIEGSTARTGNRANRRARRSAGLVGTAIAVMAGTVVGLSAPAGATVTVATSGTTMTVALTGAETPVVSCVGGVVSVNGKTGSPTVPCATLTKITFTGDSAAQNVDGSKLENPVFAAKPSLAATLGFGADVLTETTRADAIDMGAGNDNLYLVAGASNTNLELGADTDSVRLYSTAGAEEVTASSTSTVLTLTHEIGAVQHTTIVKNAESLEVATQAGDDTIDLSGITTTASVKGASAYGGEGNDTVRGAQVATNLFAGPGNNQIFGGAGNDNIGSEGNGDVIDPGAGSNFVFDRNSGRSGRTITGSGTDNTYTSEMGQGDLVTRIRPGSGTGFLVTHSLARPGQQPLGASFGNIVAYNGSNAVADGRGLFDVVALGNSRDVAIDGDAADNDLLDVTIPTGSWTVAGNPAENALITPNSPNYKPIAVHDIGTMKVHGPWTDKNSGFAHRVTRDLAFRFATDQTIASTSAALTQGTTTRTAVVDGLMKTDEYRGLDVDRVFTRYLRRSADSGGRTYWINAISKGRALWRFRAQLFGSNEYFTKAGASNGAYLDKVYLDVLGRLPDPSGRAFWLGKLDAGAERGSVALQFINAAEFRRTTVDNQYLRFLDRKPTAAEQDTWVKKLAGTATGEQDLIASLATSTEYLNRT